MNEIKQRVLSLAILMLGINSVYAQRAFEEGKLTFASGYGFGNVIQTMYIESSKSDIGFKSYNFGPLHFKAEYGITDGVGVGLSINYVRAGASFKNSNALSDPYNYHIMYQSLSALLRFNFHLGKNEKIDPYIGLGLGGRTGEWWENSYEDKQPFIAIATLHPLGFEAVFGLRYYIVPNVGLYTEIGMAKSLIQFGVVGNF